MSVVRPFERRQPARHINPGQAPKDRAALGLKEMPKFWEQALESERAFALAMLAETVGRVRSSADFL